MNRKPIPTMMYQIESCSKCPHKDECIGATTENEILEMPVDPHTQQRYTLRVQNEIIFCQQHYPFGYGAYKRNQKRERKVKE